MSLDLLVVISWSVETKSNNNEVWSELKFDMTMYRYIYIYFVLNLNFKLKKIYFKIKITFFFVLDHFESTNILQVHYIGNLTWLVSCHILVVLVLIVRTGETKPITNEVLSELMQVQYDNVQEFKKKNYSNFIYIFFLRFYPRWLPPWGDPRWRLCKQLASLCLHRAWSGVSGLQFLNSTS